MTVKQTDRVQIMAYGDRGRALFDEIEVQMRSLVSQVAEVPYEGQNAYEFKSACVAYSVDFARNCTASMQSISAVITDATTFIATALGGAAINLEPPTVLIDAPAVSADTSIESAEDGALIALRGSVEATFAHIEQCFTENLSNLQNLGADGWIGPEYDGALADVSTVTTNAVQEVATSRLAITNTINGQLQALGMAS